MQNIRISNVAIVIGVIILSAFLLGFNPFPPGDGRTIQVTAEGTAEWLYQDTHTEDHGLDEEKFGTPANPKGLNIVPLANREVTADGKRYAGLKDGQAFSFDRTMVTGSIRIDATDLTPLDTTTSWDEAHMESTFFGPGGERFKVVLKTLANEYIPVQAFGGVVFNHLLHGETDLGKDVLNPVFAYVQIMGFGDVYRDDELIAEDVYFYISTAQNAFALNQDKKSGTYNYADPFGKLIVHLVVLPYNQKNDYTPVRTGIIGPDGKEQIFFHVNFNQNITVTGNRFFNATEEHTK